MLPGSKSKRGSAHGSEELQATAGKPVFEPGSYVMALWRNQYEYLAEVLAFRQRSREHPEYRIKFLWDRVVEWTPASCIRRATQAEITYVLKLLRHNRQSDPPKKEAPVEQEKPSIEASGDGNEATVAKGDMLYDRNIVQFHEACKKRRELKRRAVLSDGEERNSAKQRKLDQSKVSPSVAPQAIKQESHFVKQITTSRKKPLKTPTIPEIKPTTWQKTAPTTFQCPHCPRTLRRQSLLTAHLQNYHSEQSGSQQSPVESSIPKKKTETETENQLKSEAVKSERYIFCPPCKFSGPSTEAPETLIQCFVCRVWSHRRCIPQPGKSWICSACSRTPSSRSPFSDWPEVLQYCSSVKHHSDSDSSSLPSIAELVQETSSLISWLYHLSTLITTGHHTLCRIKRAGSSGCDVGTQSTTAATAAPKDSCGDGNGDLAMDFPFIGAPHAVSGDEQFNALFLQIAGFDGLSGESEGVGSSQRKSTASISLQPPATTPCTSTLEPTDISRILANLANSSPEDLPDLITTIPDDLLNVASTHNQPPGHQQLSSPSQVPPSLTPSTLFDTPTKSLLANIDQEMDQGVGRLYPSNATISAPDFERQLSGDPSPMITPMKNMRSGNAATSANDIEAAASLIGFAEGASRTEFGVPVTAPPTVTPTPLHGAKSHEVSSELESLHSEILIPLEEMIALIETRLDAIESQVARICKNHYFLKSVEGSASPLTSPSGRNPAIFHLESDEHEDNDSASVVSRTPISSPSSSSKVSPEKDDAQLVVATYPQPKFAPKRRIHQRRFF
ncbi:unnamed protein product [Mesocestoides corti]|uniref:C2H2-type domain-containing protein n=1 Tax=Mesocestoides corti TaxID=53468 RepID=A0A0R3UFX9_MESCO|nr:unnamed protein product [Mesocestoides corti]